MMPPLNYSFHTRKYTSPSQVIYHDFHYKPIIILLGVQITGILLNASTSPDENDAIDVEMQCDMLFLVASLCEGDTHRKV